MVKKKGYIDKQKKSDDKESGKDKIVKLDSSSQELSKIVASKANRISRKKKEGDIRIIQGVKSALSVGWSLVIPLGMCLALGLWIDGKVETDSSIIVILMVIIGIVLGGVNVWYNLKKEKLIDREVNEKVDKKEEKKFF
ncbi:MAG: AtpZ/AtpI family protein [Alphaproteobacteria bacterium]|nr:AtpZ/AtpI family protein [Alphaproteobacteria bacterium]